MPARGLMIQGTGSDVGKSLLVAGLCRAYRRRGVDVLPFKSQNMSNNAAVTPDGGEIGRAQALQARAAGVEPSVDMNPVLLKPQTDKGAQIVLAGRLWGNAAARDYHALKPRFLETAVASYRRLVERADLILIEGAGSPAEINLRAGDIANMGFAEAADLPVVLIGDIERGGVIAQIVGTQAVLDDNDSARLAGFIVNKFRGDPTLFAEGMTMIEQRTGLPGLGLVPLFPAARLLPAEDALALSEPSVADQAPARAIKIAVPVLSRIANFDDFDPLAAEPSVRLVMVPAGQALPGDADVIILPGSKSTLGDLAFLRDQGWDTDIFAHHRRGGAILGICGGYQMLGRRVEDPNGIEGAPGTAGGLGLLDITTRLGGDKTLTSAAGSESATGQPVHGYEMHIGRSEGPDCARPMLTLAGRPDGAVSSDGRVAGCYLHGLFAADGFRGAWLARFGGDTDAAFGYDRTIDDVLDRLAAHLETHLDLDRLFGLAS